MDNDPIKEPKSIFEMIKDAYKIVFKKPKKEIYFASLYELDEIKKLSDSLCRFGEVGISVDELEGRWVKNFNKII